MKTKLMAVAAAAILAAPLAHAEKIGVTMASFDDTFLTILRNSIADSAKKDGATAGWLLVDQVIGKAEAITYALALDAHGAVTRLEVLEYRETHGGEIRLPAWRKQFVGKTAADPVRLDADIHNISGATLSCRHVTDGVRRLLSLHAHALKTM